MPVDNVRGLIIDAEEGRTDLGYIGRISNLCRHAKSVVIVSVD